MEIEKQKLVDNWSCYYLLENNEILTSDEYWALNWETKGEHSPAIASSPERDALLKRAKTTKG